MKPCTAVLLCLLALPSVFYGQENNTTKGASAPAKRPEEVRDRYHAVQVDPVTIHDGVQFPAEYLAKLQAEIGKELKRQKEFVEVLGPGETPSKAGTPTLRLSEEITSYEPGSRAKRYFGGYGAGSTVVNSRIVFMDGDNSHEFMTEELRAVLAGGLFGGGAEGVVQDFSRQIVTKTKLMLTKRLPEPEDAVPSNVPMKESAGSGEISPERHTIQLPGTNWNDAQEKLNQESALGFRAVGINLTGKNKAEVVLVMADASSGHYDYKLLHTILPSTLEKEMNRASSDGFRMAKETLSIVGSSISVIMEKPPDPASEHYEYRANRAILISSSQKNTEKNEAKGYMFVAEAEEGGTHVLIFEKTADQNK